MLLPKISQETLAQMIGTTRSRVSFFMNRFRNMGFLNYNGRIHVHKSLLSVVLHDHSHDANAKKPDLLETPRPRSKSAKRIKNALTQQDNGAPAVGGAPSTKAKVRRPAAVRLPL